MNIHTNTSIVESHLFDKVFIPPCPDDSGLSLGAAAYLEWKKDNIVKKHVPYLNDWGVEEYSANYSTEDLQQVALLIAEGKVIGICNGASEAGPRALGNRSLISLPTKALAYKVSVEYKQREWYRPVAPVMLEKNARYFTGQNPVHPLTRYMLLDLKIPEEKQQEIPGVIHANGTARIQTIFSKEDNPFMFDLLTLLDEQFNVKALINTSFNRRGEPIVHTEADALKAAREMDIDAVVLNGKVVLLHS